MLVNLHLLRFLAAGLVLAYHVSQHVWATGIPRGGLLYAAELVGFGGVDVFFVISGFIMWYTTRTEHGPVAAWRFLRRRAARIYSGYWPFLLLALWLWAVYHPQLLDTKNWLGSVFLIPSPLGTTAQLDPGRLIIPVSWTLMYELYFYLAFGVLIATRKRMQRRMILIAAAAVGSASLYASVSGVFTPDRLLESSLLFTLYLSPFCLQFLAGALIGELFRTRAIPRPLTLLLAGLVLLAGTGWLNATIFEGNLISGYHTPARVLLFTAPACLFVMGAAGLDQQGRNRLPGLCLILGGSSYALYLAHTLWLQWLFDIGVRDWLAGNDILAAGYGVAALVIIALCALYYRFVERPLHRLFRSLLRAGKRTEI